MNQKKDKYKFWTIKAIIHTVFFGMAAGVIYPLLWTISNSLKGNKEFYVNNFGLPMEPRWQNYIEAWERGIGTFYYNSFFVTIVAVVVSTFLAAAAAYGLTRFNVKGRKGIFLVIIGGLMISQQVATLSLFEMLRAVNLYDTYWAMILPYIAFRIPFSVFFMYPYFSSFPKEIEESAVIDGCNSFEVFMRIILPISKPILASCAIMAAMFTWNEFIFALIFIESDALYTIPIGLMAFKDALSTNWGPLLAGVVLSTIPMIVFFLSLQKYFVTGLTSGSTKG